MKVRAAIVHISWLVVICPERSRAREERRNGKRNFNYIDRYNVYVVKYNKQKRKGNNMKRTFIEVPAFTKKWRDLGLGDEDLRELENVLLEDPKTGDIIQGTGGLRKIRVSLNQKGKRGGARVIYVDVEVKETIYFINVYSKKEKSDLTESEKKALKAVVTILKGE